MRAYPYNDHSPEARQSDPAGGRRAEPQGSRPSPSAAWPNRNKTSTTSPNCNLHVDPTTDGRPSFGSTR